MPTLKMIVAILVIIGTTILLLIGNSIGSFVYEKTVPPIHTALQPVIDKTPNGENGWQTAQTLDDLKSKTDDGKNLEQIAKTGKLRTTNSFSMPVVIILGACLAILVQLGVVPKMK